MPLLFSISSLFLFHSASSSFSVSPLSFFLTLTLFLWLLIFLRRTSWFRGWWWIILVRDFVGLGWFHGSVVRQVCAAVWFDFGGFCGLILTSWSNFLIWWVRGSPLRIDFSRVSTSVAVAVWRVWVWATVVWQVWLILGFDFGGCDMILLGFVVWFRRGDLILWFGGFVVSVVNWYCDFVGGWCGWRCLKNKKERERDRQRGRERKNKKWIKNKIEVLIYIYIYIFFFFLKREFQLMVFAPDSSSLLLDQDTNQFLV